MSQEQLTITKRPTVDNVKEICSSDSERDESGSTIQKTLTDESLGQETKSADGQNSHTDTDDLCGTFQRYFDEPTEKYTRPMMASMEECLTKIAALLTRVGRDLDANIDATPFRKGNKYLGPS